MVVRSLRAVHADELAKATHDDVLAACQDLERLMQIVPDDYRRSLELAVAALEAVDTAGRGGARASEVLSL